MIHFLSRRLLLTVPVLLGVATLVFSLIHLVPGDPVQAMLGESAAPADLVELRAVITETIFAWPGVGRLLIQSIGFRDYPLVQGCILLIAVTYVLVNLVTDMMYGLLDPRIRYE